MIARGIACVLLLASCADQSAPSPSPSPSIDLGRPAPAVPSVVIPPPPVKQALPVDAEVELSGVVKAPPRSAGQLHVLITDGECWTPAAHALGELVKPLSDGAWFREVIVKQGTMLWVCAAMVDGKKPITLYASIGKPLRGEGAGEVSFQHLDLTLARGKPVTLPPKK